MSKLIAKLALKALVYTIILFGIQHLMISAYPMVEPFFPAFTETLDATALTETGRNTWTITAELSEIKSNPLRNEATCLLIYLGVLNLAVGLFILEAIGGLIIVATSSARTVDEDIDDMISIF